MLVGGAALTRNFVDRQIAPAYGGTVAYAQDAMTGWTWPEQIVDPAKFEALKAAARASSGPSCAKDAAPAVAEPVATRRRSRRDRAGGASSAAPPDFERHVILDTPPDQSGSTSIR